MNTLILDRSLRRNRRLLGEVAGRYRQGHDGKARGDVSRVVVGFHQLQHGVPLNDDFLGGRCAEQCSLLLCPAECRMQFMMSLSRRKAAIESRDDWNVASSPRSVASSPCRSIRFPSPTRST